MATLRQRVWAQLTDTPQTSSEIKAKLSIGNAQPNTTQVTMALSNMRTAGHVESPEKGLYRRKPGSKYTGEKPKRENRHCYSQSRGVIPMEWGKQKTTTLTTPPSRDRCEGGECAFIRPKIGATGCEPCNEVMRQRAVPTEAKWSR